MTVGGGDGRDRREAPGVRSRACGDGASGEAGGAPGGHASAAGRSGRGSSAHRRDPGRRDGIPAPKDEEGAPVRSEAAFGPGPGRAGGGRIDGPRAPTTAEAREAAAADPADRAPDAAAAPRPQDRGADGRGAAGPSSPVGEADAAGREGRDRAPGAGEPAPDLLPAAPAASSSQTPEDGEACAPDRPPATAGAAASARRGRGDPLDPRGLVAEAYRMPGIAAEECRAILLDWALGRGAAEGDGAALAALHARHAPSAPDHPMTALLAEGLAAPPPPGRRGGARGRRRG